MKPGRIIIMALITRALITRAPITRGALTPGAGGSCEGKSEAIRVPPSIWRGRGPGTDQTLVVLRLAPSWCGPTMWERLSATKTANGSSKAAMTATAYARGLGPSPARSPSATLKPKPAGRGTRLRAKRGRRRHDPSAKDFSGAIWSRRTCR